MREFKSPSSQLCALDSLSCLVPASLSIRSIARTTLSSLRDATPTAKPTCGESLSRCLVSRNLRGTHRKSELLSTVNYQLFNALSVENDSARIVSIQSLSTLLDGLQDISESIFHVMQNSIGIFIRTILDLLTFCHRLVSHLFDFLDMVVAEPL